MILEQTAKTPQIDLNKLTGNLIFAGKSIPENAAKLYEPILNWVTEYSINAKPTTNVRFNLEYFNTSSSIWLAKTLKVLTQINNPDYVLIIHLYMDIEEYDEIEEFDDIKEFFFPIANVFQDAIPSTSIKLYGISDDGETIKETMVVI